jgi:hypothetical protein
MRPGHATPVAHRGRATTTATLEAGLLLQQRHHRRLLLLQQTRQRKAVRLQRGPWQAAQLPARAMLLPHCLQHRRCSSPLAPAATAATAGTATMRAQVQRRRSRVGMAGAAVAGAAIAAAIECQQDATMAGDRRTVTPQKQTMPCGWSKAAAALSYSEFHNICWHRVVDGSDSDCK